MGVCTRDSSNFETASEPDTPAIKPPPERDAWKRAHGKAPVRVETEPRFVDRALECISRVNSTIERFNEQEYAAKAAHIWQLALSGKHNMRRSSEEADPSSESK